MLSIEFLHYLAIYISLRNGGVCYLGRVISENIGGATCWILLGEAEFRPGSIYTLLAMVKYLENENHDPPILFARNEAHQIVSSVQKFHISNHISNG